jgi:hypothetical protein
VPRCNGLWGRTGHGKQDWLTISGNIASGELAFDNISPKTRLFTVLSMVWNAFGKPWGPRRKWETVIKIRVTCCCRIWIAVAKNRV